MERAVPSVFVFGGRVLDTCRRELRDGARVIAIEPQVFDLLEFLIRNRERTVSRDDLLASIWGGRVVSDSTIDVRINAARRAIGDHGGQQSLIRTLPRKGFRFVADVREVPSAAEASAPALQADDQRVTFCRTADGVNIATATTGQGVTVIRTSTWFNHIEYEWKSPLRLPLLRFLHDRYHLVRYDGRGVGLSDRKLDGMSFENLTQDLEAVVDGLKLRRYALLGISQGAPIAIAHAVRHPERVSHLVLHGAFALGRNRRLMALERDRAQALLALMRQGWGGEQTAFMRAFSSVFFPGASRERIKWLAELQAMATTGENAVMLQTACDDIDIVDFLPKVRVPTLVSHCRNDNIVPFAEGRRVATDIPGAKFVLLESENHIPLEDEPAWPKFLGEIESFLADRTK